MPLIKIETIINADIDKVFDLSRSVDFHQISTEQTNEKVIAGRLSGLMELNETVTWRARHFGIYQNLTSKITEMKPPNYFVDEMITGAFKSFRHEHRFRQEGSQTVMVDTFEYTSPFGPIGKLADLLFLKAYMKRLLIKRNHMIKSDAEIN